MSGIKKHIKKQALSGILASEYNEKDAENYEFLSDVCYVNSSPMCGNSICQDRRFLFKSYQIWRNFSTRNLDVSSFKGDFKRWSPEKLKISKKRSTYCN